MIGHATSTPPKSDHLLNTPTGGGLTPVMWQSGSGQVGRNIVDSTCPTPHGRGHGHKLTRADVHLPPGAAGRTTQAGGTSANASDWGKVGLVTRWSDSPTTGVYGTPRSRWATFPRPLQTSNPKKTKDSFSLHPQRRSAVSERHFRSP